MFATAAVIAYLGKPLNLPDTIVSLAPFNRVGYPPLEAVGSTDLLGLSVVTAVLVGVAFLGFRRRGIPHG